MNETPVLEDADVLPDEPPINPPEYACEVCGKELEYSGRGRKPKYCDEHKGGRKGTSTPRKSTAKADATAKQAAAALAQLNALIGMGLMAAPKPWGMPQTASALAERNDAFEESAYQALLTDPKLAAMIVRGGATSGKVALIIAYGMLGFSIYPTAQSEWKANRANRAEGD